MTFIDFNARAELYLGSDHASAQAEGAREFRTAASALRFALEEAAPISLRGARLIVGGLTFTGTGMAELYRAADYPLGRKAPRRPVKKARHVPRSIYRSTHRTSAAASVAAHAS
jgi:hypothetical protein